MATRSQQNKLNKKADSSHYITCGHDQITQKIVFEPYFST